MKLLWFHLMPYTELPEDFRMQHSSVWVDIPSSLFDSKRAHYMYNDFMDELEYAAYVKAYSPELNPMEKVWDYLRQNKLCALVWDGYDDIVEACKIAWNWLIAGPARITSIGERKWAVC